MKWAYALSFGSKKYSSVLLEILSSFTSTTTVTISLTSAAFEEHEPGVRPGLTALHHLPVGPLGLH